MKQEFDFSNKAIVITGATAGIGYQTALEFCRRGASVIGVGRSAQRCQQAQERIAHEIPAAKIHFLVADLAQQQEVRKLAVEIQQYLKEKRSPGLDVLVNNAGTFMNRLTLTPDGVETTMAVNHMAPFLLTHLLLPQLAAQANSRVITVSSDSHFRTFINPDRLRKPLIYISLWAYKVSKLANVLFTLEFNARQKGKAPHAFAVDPGLVNTDIGLKSTGALASFIWRQRQKAGVDPIQPATTILFLAGDKGAPLSDAVYWHDCAPKTPSPTALDTTLALRLWQESSKICAIDA